MPKSKYKAAIIGCGIIGTNGVLSHAYGYRHDPRVQLTAVVDTDQSALAAAAAAWKVNGYRHIKDLFKNEKIDIISICVPDTAHERILNECIKYKPMAVICEKPLTTQLAGAIKMVNRYKQHKILLSVNYSRRYNHGISALKKKIQQGQFGSLINAVGVYTKGTLHNGSHMIDLIRNVLGEVADVKVLGRRVDWKKTDPTIDAFLSLTNGAGVHLAAGDERVHSVFELDMFFSRARVSLRNFGEDLIIESARPPKKIQRMKMKLSGNILTAIGNVIDALEGKAKLLSSAQEAVKTEQVCHQLLKDKIRSRAWKN